MCPSFYLASLMILTMLNPHAPQTYLVKCSTSFEPTEGSICTVKMWLTEHLALTLNVLP